MRPELLKKTIWPLIVITVIAVYYLAPWARVIEPVQSGLARLGGIFQHIGWKTRGGWENISGTQEYREKYQKIAAENVLLSAANARLKSYENENRQLRSLLQFKEKTALTRQIPAKIIGTGILLGRKILIIDRGRDDGLSADFPVISPAGVLVGKIQQIGARTAKVVLLADSESAVAAQISGNPKIQGVLKGQNGLSLSFELIPAGEPLRSGDLVESSLLEDNTPAGLLIGKVIAVSEGRNELFKKALVAPLTNLADLGLVTVIVPEEP